MSATTASEGSRTSFWRASLLLAGSVLVGGLALAPFAVSKSGSAGVGGVALAGAICLAAGLLAEGLAHLLGRSVSPLATMLLGMTIRMLPPLGICLFLAAQGARGREHLAFIVYLLAFYLVTLALETRLNVSRISAPSVASKSRASSQQLG
ncbi:MAG: hypothetical protein AB7G28_23110 [Pirellulales bacterium]